MGDDNDVGKFNGFVRKVLAIVIVQILVTLAVLMPFLFVDELKQYVRSNDAFRYSFFALLLAVLLIMAFWDEGRKTQPINIILLVLLTTFAAIATGIVGAHTNYPFVVLIAVGVALAFCIVLMLFACQLKFDITGIVPYLELLVLIVVLLVIGAYIWVKDATLVIVVSFTAVVILALFLIVAIQQMRLGTFENDIIYAAVCIYVIYVLICTNMSHIIGHWLHI